MKCKILFSRKQNKKKFISLSSAKFTNSMINIKS